jgi:L-threonylcarbamoyladenylate synthase
MQTDVKQTRLLESTPANIVEAAQILRSGQLVAFPTETVYGLGACVFNEAAVRSIFVAKGRPSDNPLIVHCADKQDMERVTDLFAPIFTADVQRFFHALFERFCPGPLTFVLPKHSDVPDSVTAGLETVAVRFPAHSVAVQLIRAAGEPLVAPSANRSAYPSPTTAAHVLHDLEGRIAAVLDGGACAVGIESTVVNILTKPPVILRPGHITKKELDEVAIQLGMQPFYDVAFDSTVPAIPPSPGMKYRHYAPNAAVVLVESLHEAEIIQQRFHSSRIFAHSSLVGEVSIHPLSEQNLYAELRSADDDGIDGVIIVCSDALRLNIALMNRITKASEKAIETGESEKYTTDI